jgi:hypothetical protein
MKRHVMTHKQPTPENIKLAEEDEKRVNVKRRKLGKKDVHPIEVVNLVNMHLRQEEKKAEEKKEEEGEDTDSDPGDDADIQPGDPDWPIEEEEELSDEEEDEPMNDPSPDVGPNKLPINDPPRALSHEQYKEWRAKLRNEGGAPLLALLKDLTAAKKENNIIYMFSFRGPAKDKNGHLKIRPAAKIRKELQKLHRDDDTRKDVRAFADRLGSKERRQFNAIIAGNRDGVYVKEGAETRWDNKNRQRILQNLQQGKERIKKEYPWVGEIRRYINARLIPFIRAKVDAGSAAPGKVDDFINEMKDLRAEMQKQREIDKAQGGKGRMSTKGLSAKITRHLNSCRDNDDKIDQAGTGIIRDIHKQFGLNPPQASNRRMAGLIYHLKGRGADVNVGDVNDYMSFVDKDRNERQTGAGWWKDFKKGFSKGFTKVFDIVTEVAPLALMAL